jgi:palmitoyl-protein thioesterase
LNATAFYNQDYIGLKKLTEEGKVSYVTLEGDHLQFTKDDVEKIMIPFLNK